MIKKITFFSLFIFMCSFFLVVFSSNVVYGQEKQKTGWSWSIIAPKNENSITTNKIEKQKKEARILKLENLVKYLIEQNAQLCDELKEAQEKYKSGIGNKIGIDYGH